MIGSGELKKLEVPSTSAPHDAFQMVTRLNKNLQQKHGVHAAAPTPLHRKQHTGVVRVAAIPSKSLEVANQQIPYEYPALVPQYL